MKKYYLIFAVIFLLGIHYNLQSQEKDSVPDFTVTDVNGQVHNLYDYLEQGKYVLIDFFTTGCGSCQQYASQVNQSYLDFGCNEGGVIFIAINFGAYDEQVIDFDTTYGIEFPSVSGIDGGGNQVVDDYGITYYPRIMLISPYYKIVEDNISPPETDRINNALLDEGLDYMECGTAGITEAPAVEAEIFSFWPNPAKSSINIEVNAWENSQYTIEIMNILGEIIREDSFTTNYKGTYVRTLQLDNLTEGTYLVRLNQSGIPKSSKKLMIID